MGRIGLLVSRPTTSTQGQVLANPFTNCAMPTSSSSW